MNNTFTESLTVRPVHELHLSPGELETFQNGGKCILNDVILAKILHLNLFVGDEPMQFRIHSPMKRIVLHVGVLNFNGSADSIYLPDWVMEYMAVSVGDYIMLVDTKLPKGTSIKIQFQSCDYLSFDNPEGILTSILPNYSCLTCGQFLRFRYLNKVYDVKVVSTKPDTAISLINTNVETEFEEPVGYAEYVETLRKTTSVSSLGSSTKDTKDANDDTSVWGTNNRILAGTGSAVSLGSLAANSASKPSSVPACTGPLKPVAGQQTLDSSSDDKVDVQKALKRPQFTGRGRRL